MLGAYCAALRGVKPWGETAARRCCGIKRAEGEVKHSRGISTPDEKEKERGASTENSVQEGELARCHCWVLPAPKAGVGSWRAGRGGRHLTPWPALQCGAALREPPAAA